MARKPALLRAFNGLVAAVMRDPGELPAELKWLIAHAVSASAGCRYCQAHTAANSAKAGLPVAKIEALMEYETSAIFSPAERAAVALALAAGQCRMRPHGIISTLSDRTSARLLSSRSLP